MDFSVWPAPRTWHDIVEVARAADAGGWHGLWLADHFMQADDRTSATTEVWAALSALANATDRLRLGSLVCSVTYRHPAVLAATATMADHISGGRIVLGIGAGWQMNEHRAYGIELGTERQRSDRLEEAAEVIHSLLNEERTTFDGTYFRFDDAPNEPKPVQRPLPLLVAGKGEVRTMRTAARHAEEWNGWCTPEEMTAKRAVLARHLEAAGREPDAMRCSTQAFVCFSEEPSVLDEFASRTVGRPTLAGSTDAILEQVAAFAAAGTDELIVPDWLIDDPAARLDHYARFRSEVIDAFAS